MTSDHRIKFLAAAWTGGALLVALISQIVSPAGWLMAGVVAFGPSLTLLYFWQEPAQTTTQRIRDARR